MKLADLIAKCTGFDWDEGNLPKIWEAHKVSGAAQLRHLKPDFTLGRVDFNGILPQFPPNLVVHI